MDYKSYRAWSSFALDIDRNSQSSPRVYIMDVFTRIMADNALSHKLAFVKIPGVSEIIDGVILNLEISTESNSSLFDNVA